MHTQSGENDGDAGQIDLRRLLADPDPGGLKPRRSMQERNDPPAQETLDDWLFAEAAAAVESKVPIALSHAIRNTDRSVGARLAGEIARRCGDAGLPPGTITCTLTGSAGQSFGAFCIHGVKLVLYGEANDYVGKGMAGGEIVVRLPQTASYASQENFIIGNTVLYGATGGRLFAAGRAGERFAVRNSGATAVVEGVGDHGCEYMTGGVVVVLGEVGRNFGAGMTGGQAFVYDPRETLGARLNPELVRMERPDEAAAAELRALVAEHARECGSGWAQGMLERWGAEQGNFQRVVPRG